LRLINFSQNYINQWQSIFWLCAAFSAGGAMFYILVGSGVEQPWAKGGNKKHVAKGKSKQVESFLL